MPPILPTPGPARHRNTGVDDPVQASAALWLIAGGVDAVLAALALSPEAGDEDPHILGGQLGQPLVAQLGDEVEADHALVSLVGAGFPLWLDHVLQPVGEVLRDGPALGR